MWGGHVGLVEEFGFYPKAMLETCEELGVGLGYDRIKFKFRDVPLATPGAWVGAGSGWKTG